MSPLTALEHLCIRAIVSVSKAAGKPALVAALDRIRPESPPMPDPIPEKESDHDEAELGTAER